MALKGAFHFTGCYLQNEEGIWVRGQFGRFVDALAAEVDHLDLLLNEKKIECDLGFEAETDYRITATNVRVVSLGPCVGRFAPIKRLAVVASKLPAASRNWDFLLIREPSRRSSLIRRWSRSAQYVFLLGGDWTPSLGGRVTGFVYWRARYFLSSMRKAMRSSLVFVNNEVLLNRWGPYAGRINLTRTSTLTHAIIQKTPIARFEHALPYHLLYVGRIDPLKGLDTLMQAMAILNQDSLKFKLVVVGSGNTPYMNALKQQVSELNLTSSVQFVGHQAADDIWAYYCWADIFVLPTLVENISRCIWEAMSQSCPVITTPVGGQGIAFKDEQDVLFMSPGSVENLVKNVIRLANDNYLRSRLGRNGLETARSNTVELRAKEIVEGVGKWLKLR